ncbi:MAG: DUF4430 domain-containing protein [Solobacterium sp.]|nr:DUF4430 domain-containing protein [Solobacterium sp.]
MKNKKTLYSVIGIILAIAIMFGLYKAFGPKAQSGSKSVTVEVVDDKGDIKAYGEKTDAEFLKEVMDEISKTTDFSYEGTDSEYGLYITAINGITADYNSDGAYWAIYVNDEYGMYGADQQPVADGDKYSFVYEKAN